MQNSKDETCPIVFLPGLICNAAIFEGQKSAFKDAIIIDGYPDCTSLEMMADHVLASAPEKFDLFGHSMGGRIAMEVFRKSARRINRLILANTGVHARREGEREKRYQLRNLGREKGFETLVDTWLRPMMAPNNQVNTSLYFRLKKMCMMQKQSDFERQIEALLSRPELVSLLPVVDCPTLVITGELDLWASPKQHQKIAQSIKGAQLKIIEGAGHMLPAEAPEDLNRVIKEWRQKPVKRHFLNEVRYV